MPALDFDSPATLENIKEAQRIALAAWDSREPDDVIARAVYDRFTAIERRLWEREERRLADYDDGIIADDDR